MTTVLHAAETAKGGVATVISQLLSYPEGKHRSVCIVPAGHEPEGRFANATVVTYRRTGRNLYSFAQFFLTFISQVWRVRPDVVHLHSTFAGTMGRMALFLMKPFRRPMVIYSPHGFAFLMDKSDRFRRAVTLIERMAAVATNKIICVSQHELSAASANGLPPAKLCLIYNGVEVDVVQSVTPARSGPIRALFVGRLDRQKGIDTLVCAMRYLQDSAILLEVIGESVSADSAQLRWS